MLLLFEGAIRRSNQSQELPQQTRKRRARKSKGNNNTFGTIGVLKGPAHSKNENFYFLVPAQTIGVQSS